MVCSGPVQRGGRSHAGEEYAIGQDVILQEKYRLKQKLGSGSFAQVYLAEDVRLHRFWAVKELTGSRGSGFHEAEMMRSLDYPSLPRIVDLFEARGKVYLVMDYVEGETVGALLRAGKSFTKDQVIETGIALAETLVYLHGRKPPLIYRDLKPDNVIWTEEGQIKLIDFGIAVRCPGGAARVRAAGSRGYAAPEQYQGISDPRTDIYGLGMVLKAMSRNRGRGLRRIIKKCIRERREDRYQEAGEVARALRILQKDREKDRAGCKWILAGLSILLAGAVGSTLWNEAAETRYGQLMRDAGQEEAGTAILLCESAAELFPEREEPLLLLLEISVRSGKTEEGLLRTEKILRSAPDEKKEWSRLYRELGILCFCGSLAEEDFPADYERAAAYLKRAGERSEGCKRLGELAEILSGWGKEVSWEEAWACLQEIEARADRMGGGQGTEAVALYRACGSIYFTDAQYLEAFTAYPYRESIRLFEKAQTRYADSKEETGENISLEIWEYISAACYLEGERAQEEEVRRSYLEKSAAYGERLLEAEGAQGLQQRILLRQADILGELGQREEMYICYERYRERFPEELQGSCAYAAELMEDGELEKAWEVLEEAGELPGAGENRNYQILKEELEGK